MTVEAAKVLALAAGLDEELARTKENEAWVTPTAKFSALYTIAYKLSAGVHKDQAALVYELFLQRLDVTTDSLLPPILLLRAQLDGLNGDEDDEDDEDAAAAVAARWQHLEQPLQQLSLVYKRHANLLYRVFRNLSYYVSFENLHPLEQTTEIHFRKSVFTKYALPEVLNEWFFRRRRAQADNDDDGDDDGEAVPRLPPFLADQFARWRRMQTTDSIAQLERRIQARWRVVQLLHRNSPLPMDLIRFVCHLMPVQQQNT